MYYFDLNKVHPRKHTKIREVLLWEYDLENFDYDRMKNVVVQRVVERGNAEDFYTIFNLYGVEGVKDTIRRIPYLNGRDMNFVHKVFEIPLGELRCYRNKRSRTRHWRS